MLRLDFALNRARKMGRVVPVVIALGAIVSISQAQTSTEQKQLPIEWKAGEKALREERFGAAIAHFNRVLTTLNHPDSRAEAETLVAAHHNRADAHYSLNEFSAALKDYSRVIELSPKNADAYAFRAVARKTTGDYSGLLSDAERAAKLDPEYESLLDDARSTVLYRRVLLGFLILGAVVLALGAIPLVHSLVQLLKAG